MSIRNELLEQIVIASGGVPRNPNNRNMLLEDWLLRASIPVDAKLYYLFSQNDLNSARTELVNLQNTLISNRASPITIPQTNGGSLIFDNGVPAFDRGYNLQVWDSLGGSAPDSEAASTFTENGLMVDSPSDDGGANIATCTPASQTTITISGSQKYAGSLSSSLVGTLIEFQSNGAICEITANPNATDLTVQVLKGVIPVSADEIIRLDLTQSAYFTNPIAAGAALVRTLRINAGDPAAFLDSLPAPALIPANDFELIFTCKFNGNPAAAIILENLLGVDLSNRISISREAGGFRFSRARLGSDIVDSVSSSAIANVSGREFIFAAAQSSVNGITLTITEVDGAYSDTINLDNADTRADTNGWNRSVSIGSRGGVQFFANISVKSLSVTPI